MRELLWTAGRRKATGALRRSVLRPKASTSLAPLLRGEGWGEGCLRKFECPTGKSLLVFRNDPKWFVQPLLQKYFCFLPTQISSLIRRPVSTRGALRTSPTWGRMRWTRLAHLTNGADAYGEVVWFRRPNRWRQACEKKRRRRCQKAWSPRRARSKP